MELAALNIYDSVEAAPTYEFPKFAAAELLRANIVRKGTEAGRSTVDLIFKEKGTGQLFVVMTTGRIIRSLAAAIGNEE